MTFFILTLFILLLAYGAIVDFYRRAWSRFPEFQSGEKGEVKISVIIAVRNEERNIRHLLQSLDQQDYPKDLFDVIVVDDHSFDNTWNELQNLNYPGLRIFPIRLAGNASSKKTAIATGILHSQSELIVTTDADCTLPSSWLSCMATFYSATNAKFIAAPVKMNASGTVLGVFQRIDFLTLQGITAAAVNKSFHSMCNGANLAYTRDSFMEVNGFNDIDNIPSGDDMLLMHKIFLRYPEKVYYLKSKNAVVTTEGAQTWKEFFNQRIRWASKSIHYKDKRIFYVLLVTYMLNLLLFISVFVAMFHPDFAWIFILIMVAKIIVEFPFVNSVAIFFNQQRLMKYFVFLQPMHIIYTLIAGWLGRFGSYTWKARKIKNASTVNSLISGDGRPVG